MTIAQPSCPGPEYHGALRIASWCYEQGWTPVPFRARTKIPLVPWTDWRLERPTWEQIASVWAEHPNAGVGRIIPAGEIVLDNDPRNGPLVEGWDTTSVLSGRGDGGAHYLFTLPADLDITLTRGELRPGLDLLTPGTLEILPPSLHEKTGRPYRWGNRRPPAPLPRSLADEIRTRPQRRYTALSRTEIPEADLATQDEFTGLLRGLGVTQRLRQGENMIPCPNPNHQDRHPSCSVNPTKAVFYCHACGWRGGIGVLREVAGFSVICGPTPYGRLKSKHANTKTDLELFKPRETRCGYRIMQDTRDGGRRITPVWCRRRNCSECGPHIANLHARPILASFDMGISLYAGRYPEQERDNLVRRVRRHEGTTKTFPEPGGWITVLSTVEEPGMVRIPNWQALVDTLRSAWHRAVKVVDRKIRGTNEWVTFTQVDAIVQSGLPVVGVVTVSDRKARERVEQITGHVPVTVPSFRDGNRAAYWETGPLTPAQRHAMNLALGVMTVTDYWTARNGHRIHEVPDLPALPRWRKPVVVQDRLFGGVQ